MRLDGMGGKRGRPGGVVGGRAEADDATMPPSDGGCRLSGANPAHLRTAAPLKQERDDTSHEGGDR